MPFELFSHVVNRLDSALILLRHQKYDAFKIIARTIFESSLYLQYIFEKDYDCRAHAFYLNLACLDVIKSNKKISHLIAEYEKKNKEFAKLLREKKVETPDFENEYKKCLPIIQNKDPKDLYKWCWYNYDGFHPHLCDLAEKYDELPAYYSYYFVYSIYAHGRISINNYHKEEPIFSESIQVEGSLEMLIDVIIRSIEKMNMTCNVKDLEMTKYLLKTIDQQKNEIIKSFYK